MFGIKNFSINLLSDTLFLNTVAFLVVLVLGVYLYLKTNPPLPRYIRIILAFLRVLALIAIFTALFEPIISYTRTFFRAPRITVLLDESLSMDKIDAGISRKTRRDSLLSGESFAYLKDNSDLTTFYFAENISTNKNELKTDATSIGNVLLTAESNELSSPPDYRLLFSDGNSNSGRRSSEIAPGLKTPLYSIDLTMGGESFDIGITDCQVNPIMFAGKSSDINLKLSWEKSINQTIPVQLIESGKIIAQSNFQINQSDGLGEVTLKYNPTEPGQKFLKVNLQASVDEENKNNNSRTLSVKVLKSKLAVLILSESPDYEIGFLKRYLEKAEKYDIDLRLLGGKSGNLAGSFPSRQTELNRFDLVILHDISLELLAGKKDIIESYLSERGGSLWIFMGERFSKNQPPAWLQNMLPFYQSQSRPLEYISYHGEPAEGELYHPVVRFEDNQTAIRKAWVELPPFESLVRCDQKNPNATILVYASGLQQNNDNIPIIGFMRHGAGKLFATAAQPFWVFGFINIGFGESDVYYHRFVEGVASWLTVSDDMEPIRIAPEKKVYSRGEIVRFNGFAFDQGYRPIPDVIGSVEITNDENDSYQADLIPDFQGKYKAELLNVKPGMYEFSASFSKDDRIIKEVTGKIQVSRFSLEESDTGGDPNELKTVAALSGGRYYKASEFDQLVSTLDVKPIEVNKEYEIHLWNKFWLLLLFIGALSIEWLLRKMNQLI